MLAKIRLRIGSQSRAWRLFVHGVVLALVAPLTGCIDPSGLGRVILICTVRPEIASCHNDGAGQSVTFVRSFDDGGGGVFGVSLYSVGDTLRIGGTFYTGWAASGTAERCPAIDGDFIVRLETLTSYFTSGASSTPDLPDEVIFRFSPAGATITRAGIRIWEGAPC